MADNDDGIICGMILMCAVLLVIGSAVGLTMGANSIWLGQQVKRGWLDHNGAIYRLVEFKP